MDRNTLSACSLLSHAFYNLASPVLFRSLVIDDTSPTHDIHAFLRDLRAHAICGPANLVKNLTLQGAGWNEDEHVELSIIDVHTIFAILAELPSAHSLKLVGILVKRSHDAKTAPKQRRSLKNLELHHLAFDLSRRAGAGYAVMGDKRVLCSFVQMLNMLCTVENMTIYDTETIHINKHNLNWESEPEFTMSTARFLGRLRTSRTRIKHLVSQEGTVSHDVYLELLKSSSSLKDLQTMRISDTYKSIYSFLRGSLARNLTHLHLDIEPDEVHSVPFRMSEMKLDLACCIRLATLRISTIVGEWGRSEEESQRDIKDSASRFAAALEAACIQAPDTVIIIEIEVVDSRRSPLPNDTSVLLDAAIDWMAADAALARRRDLQKVSFKFLFHPSERRCYLDCREAMKVKEVTHKAQIDLIKANLPNTSSRRNLLTVACEPSHDSCPVVL
ncbi:hypothetical protein EIP91_000621 [Steccherinum ochraceum]|uniref:Uncharacterized protein n=1 Tax=Steccherinum ochraceum TaxID=92696 RepID=A0A4R0RP26_9APHY|nr:hypothetical protein EIP91_000621 [Steccherinum ochraceum]